MELFFLLFMIDYVEDKHCQILGYESQQFGYFDFPYNLTFRVKFKDGNNQCKERSEYCFLRNNIVVDNNKRDVSISYYACPGENQGNFCFIYNFTLALRNLTANDLGNYSFLFGSHSCGCILSNQLFVDLKARECINDGIINSTRQDTSSTKVALQCTASGNPRPTIVWTRYNDGKDDDFIAKPNHIVINIISQTTIHSTLNLDRTQAYQTGNFSCKSNNLCKSVRSNSIWNVTPPSVDKPKYFLPFILIGLSTSIAAIAFLAVISRSVYRRTIVRRKKELVRQVTPSRQNILIACHGPIPSPVTELVDNSLQDISFDGRMWEINNINGKTYELEVYYEKIQYFNLIILILMDDNVTRSDSHNFNHYLRSIINKCIIDERAIIAISVNRPQNFSYLLDEIEYLEWTDDMNVNLQIEFHERLEETLHYFTDSAQFDRTAYDDGESVYFLGDDDDESPLLQSRDHHY
ncbi:uncharacterized protein TRIADDRAFT_53321 [Trichoplax adhaerens]|uniref:Ig-like domain-containing protein n=1 Tax=Trichoplax adhaerens TaxID=10228 RepID=B3RNX0_TRIAD|nr:predicted protein [Trichoplax adhaerens]EDV28089.1 predicted protein [Trichoplax adhaerens]|eukprot:XP_002109923.1 predicted protein [Trichoplax adhaerens]